MPETKEYTCIGCPIGCPLQLTHNGKEIIEVSGYECNRGKKYAPQEFTDPRRGLSTTVLIEKGLWRRLPVKVTHPIPKNQVLEAAIKIHSLKLKAPVKLGDVLIENILGEEGIHVVACRSMSKREN